MVRTFIIFFIALVFIADASNYEYDVELRKMTVERFQIYAKRLDTKKLPEDVRTRLEDPDNVPLNIAVTGESGVGKSTLVNTFRGLSPDDPDAAAVGVVETTYEFVKYTDPKYSQHIYWDLPGCGTPAYPRDAYLAEVNFELYDFFLILSASRFTENDAWLANEIQKRNKQFFYIRNKINLDLKNEERDHPKRNATEVLNEIRSDCMKNFISGNQQQKVPIYLISALLSDNDKWDFAELVNDSIRENLRIKQELLIHQLRLFSQSEIKEKAKLMRSRIFLHSLIALFIPLIPLPGIIILGHMIIIQYESDLLRSELLVDEKWLITLITSKPSHFTIIDSDLLNMNYLNYYTTVFIGYITLYWIRRSIEYVPNIAYENRRFVPKIEIGLCMVFSFGMLIFQLSRIIHLFENSSLDLINRF